ncbi:MAG: DNA-binding protein [Sodalis sp. (in: enterobacteria)]|uniref:DNA-binding protein n=1 Tax=Sodalis sp. (in: enterobacteria) TaxID=1898979 RepID=UPI0039E432CF
MTEKAWFTAKELAGLGGLPSSPNSVSRKAKTEEWEFRQIKGVKGVSYEYNVYSIPTPTRENVLNSLSLHNELKESNRSEQHEFELIWTSIFHLMNKEEKTQVIDIFKKGGLYALMPSIALKNENTAESREIFRSNQSASSGDQLSQSSINTAKILDKLTAEQRREILQRYEIDEGDNPDAINQTVTQYKKEAG